MINPISRNVITYKYIQGFTLLEILLAITIFAVLSTMVYGSLNAVLSRNEVIRDGIAVFEMAKNTLNRISMDLTGTFVEQYPEYEVPGINDPPDPYRFTAEEEFVGATDFSRLRFTSTAHLPISSDTVSGLGQIKYYVQRTDDRETDTYILRRSDIAFPYDIDQNRHHETDNDPVLCEKIESFTLTYVDENGEIHRTWDSDSESYRFATPRAVIVELVVAENDRSYEFSTRIDIPVYRKRLEDVRRN